MRKMLYLAAAPLCFLLLSADCKDKPGPNPVPPVNSPVFYKGADIGWVTQMEASGLKFYNSAGVQRDCFQLMQDIGMNSIRLRVWVNPSAGWNNETDVIAKAQRAQVLGLKIMLDFHYSDDWADPQKQNPPAAWAAMDAAGLQTAVYNHTYTVLTHLKQQGITPDWVQVGNEVDDGFLWPVAKASLHMADFAAVFNKGYEAVKAVDANIKVIVHISNGYNNSLFRWVLDGLRNNGAKWDIVGMSLYPAVSNWAYMNTLCLANTNDVISRYNTPVMICEAGMPWDQADACKSFLTDLISKMKSVPNHMGQGVFYWEPECYNNWQGYSLGAFDNSGKPTVAMQAFSN